MKEKRQGKGTAIKNRSVRHFNDLCHLAVQKPYNSNIIPVTNIETSLTRLENVRNAPNLITGCAEVQTQVSKIPKFSLFLYIALYLKDLCHFSLEPKYLRASNSTLNLQKRKRKLGRLNALQTRFFSVIGIRCKVYKRTKDVRSIWYITLLS